MPIFKYNKKKYLKRKIITLNVVVCLVIVTGFVNIMEIFEKKQVQAAEETGNLAPSATLSCAPNMSDAVINLGQIHDGRINTECTRKTDTTVKVSYVGDDYFQFDWDKEISVNKVVLSSWYCYGQAPTSWKITVLKENSNHWQEIGLLEDIDWGDNSEIQSKSLIFPKQDNVKSLRVNIMDNNNLWSKYVIKEIEIYNDGGQLYGDANQDSSVDVCDFVRMKKYIAKSDNRIDIKSADLNTDEMIDENDVSALKELLVGKESMVPTKKGYNLDWSDEFDGTDLDHNKWLTKYFPHATLANVGSEAKYSVKNGMLSMILDKETKSFSYGNDDGMKVSSIQTFEQDYLHPMAKQVKDKHVDKFDGYRTKYGYFEMRCKAPACGGGGAFAWWLIGVEDDGILQIDENGNKNWRTKHCGEVDIIENIINQSNFQRYNIIPHTDTSLTTYNVRKTLEGDFVNEWHTYAFDWTPEYMDFYIDGVKYGHTEKSIDYEMCVLISMYMVTNPDSVPNYLWGYANDVYPKKWTIDYMRVYKKRD